MMKGTAKKAVKKEVAEEAVEKTGKEAVEEAAEKAIKDKTIINTVRTEGRKKIYTNSSGNEISWVAQSPKDMVAIIKSKLGHAKKVSNIDELSSNEKGELLEGQVAQAVQEMGLLKGVGLQLKRADKLLAGDIDVLTDKYIIEVKKSFGAVNKDQLDKLINPNHSNYFNFDGKDIIYYIEGATTDKIYKQKAYDMLKNTENVIVVYNLEELKGVLLP